MRARLIALAVLVILGSLFGCGMQTPSMSSRSTPSGLGPVTLRGHLVRTWLNQSCENLRTELRDSRWRIIIRDQTGDLVAAGYSQTATFENAPGYFGSCRTTNPYSFKIPRRPFYEMEIPSVGRYIASLSDLERNDFVWNVDLSGGN